MLTNNSCHLKERKTNTEMKHRIGEKRCPTIELGGGGGGTASPPLQLSAAKGAGFTARFKDLLLGACKINRTVLGTLTLE